MGRGPGAGLKDGEVKVRGALCVQDWPQHVAHLRGTVRKCEGERKGACHILEGEAGRGECKKNRVRRRAHHTQGNSFNLSRWLPHWKVFQDFHPLWSGSLAFKTSKYTWLVGCLFRDPSQWGLSSPRVRRGVIPSVPPDGSKLENDDWEKTPKF